MNRRLLATTTRTAGRALLVLLASWALAPSSSRAGCVYPHGGSGQGVAHLDLLAIAGALSTPEGTAPPVPISPCAGLRCSNDPAPPAPSTPVVPARVESWGFLTDHSPDSSPKSLTLGMDEPAIHPSHYALPLFRPPR